MKLIENINISLSLNKGKKEIMFESIDEILQHYKPCDDLLTLIINEENKNSIIGYVKGHSFTEDDHDFIQIYKKNSNLDVFTVIYEQIRIYRGFVLKFENEGDYRSKMLKIDNGDIRGFYKLKELL